MSIHSLQYGDTLSKRRYPVKAEPGLPLTEVKVRLQFAMLNPKKLQSENLKIKQFESFPENMKVKYVTRCRLSTVSIPH